MSAHDPLNARPSLLPLAERLRVIAFHHTRPGLVPDVMREAADEIEALKEALTEATAFTSQEWLNRRRVLLGGPDMSKHDKRCVLYGDWRVECVPACSLSSPPPDPTAGADQGRRARRLAILTDEPRWDFLR